MNTFSCLVLVLLLCSCGQKSTEKTDNQAEKIVKEEVEMIDSLSVELDKAAIEIEETTKELEDAIKALDNL